MSYWFEMNFVKIVGYCNRNGITDMEDLKDALIVGGKDYWYSLLYGNNLLLELVDAAITKEKE